MNIQEMSDEEVVEQATAYALITLLFKNKNDPDNAVALELSEKYAAFEAEIIKRGIELD